MARPPALSPDLVQALVGSAHGDLDQVKALLDREPRLVNAAWDWGGGDWETGLGAAAHTGRPDIARYLLDRGARLDLFAAAMLGQLPIFRTVIEAFPGARRQAGPHGIPLPAHAEAGGAQAAAVADYLRALEDVVRAAPVGEGRFERRAVDVGLGGGCTMELFMVRDGG